MLTVFELLDDQGRQYHVGIRQGDIGRYVLMPGDPFRVARIAAHLDNARMVSHRREHCVYTGTLDGVPVSVASTGMGCPSTAIATEELIHAGADTFIRVGTAGRVCDASQKPEVRGAICTAAVRDEGTSRQYIPLEFPAVADRHVVDALSRAAHAMNLHYIEGIVHSKDAFYGELDPDGLPNAEALQNRWRMWINSGVVASEMEASALFVISTIRGCRAGAIVSFEDIDETIGVAIEGVRLLIHADAPH